MRRLRTAALCFFCLLAIFGGSAFAQQKREMTDAQKTRRLDISPEPAPTYRTRIYTGTSFRSLRVPEMTYGYVTNEENNRTFFYERMGHGNENIVVIHGGPGLPHNYLLPALVPLGQYATVWLYDARGHGLSQQNPPDETYTMEQLVDDIGAFTEAAGIRKYTLLGHSFGGMVALQYAARNPEGLVRLVLCDTAPSVGFAAEFEQNLKRLMPASDFERYEKVRNDESIPPDERLRRALRLVYPFYWYNAPKDYFLDQDIRSMNLNASAADQIWASDGMNYDVRDRLDDIDVPALVIVGRHDIVMSVDQAEEIAEKMPHAQLVVFEHSGVYPFYEENALFTQWVRSFLQYHAT
jgi:proline iminopeptidase